ncbi:hypothetical protein Tco_0398411 [Tanacetum coccineum]
MVFNSPCFCGEELASPRSNSSWLQRSIQLNRTFSSFGTSTLLVVEEGDWSKVGTEIVPAFLKYSNLKGALAKQRAGSGIRSIWNLLGEREGWPHTLWTADLSLGSVVGCHNSSGSNGRGASNDGNEVETPTLSRLSPNNCEAYFIPLSNKSATTSTTVKPHHGGSWYIHGLVLEIRGMVQETKPSTIQSEILRAGALTDDAVRDEKLSKSGDKKKGVSESGKQASMRVGNKKAKLGKEFVATNPSKNGYKGNFPKCAKCDSHH